MPEYISSEYTLEIDKVSEAEWAELLLGFEDANIYHTWTYGSLRWGEKNLSHIVLRKGSEVLALAQTRIVKLPVVGRGIGYITWGPLWRPNGKTASAENLRLILRALRNEYVTRRGLLLRVLPNETGMSVDAAEIRSIFQREGFRLAATYHRTLLLDLGPSMQELRNNLTKEWRRELRIAESNGLSLIEGTGDDLYDSFSVLYREMVARKGFMPGVDIDEFRSIQRDLPEPLKMRIMICALDTTPIAALVGSLVGEKGIYLLGATGDNGLRLKGSYLLQWRMVEWLKTRGARWYDLNGYDPESHPGTSTFKAGLAGKHAGKEVCHIGRFDACQSVVSYALVSAGDGIRAVSSRSQWLRRKVG